MKIDFYTRYKKAFSKYEDYLEKVLEWNEEVER